MYYAQVLILVLAIAAVHGIPAISNADPTAEKIIEAVVGENKSLECYTKAEEIIWTLDGKNLTKFSNKRISWNVSEVDTTRDDGHVFKQYLTIVKVDPKDAGNYSCVDGEEKTTYWVQPIIEPTIIKKSPSTITTEMGKNVTIFCYVEMYPTDDPTANVYWRKEDVDGKEYTSESDKSLNDKTRVVVVNKTHLNVTLELDNINKRDNGTYICHVGSSRKTGQVVSRATSVLVLDVPQVLIELVKAVGRDKIYMNWTVNDGNSNVTHYRLQYLKEGNSTFTYYNNKINGNATSHVVKGFQPNTNYKLKLQAINKIGDGSAYQYPDFVKTLERDPDFVPVIDVKGSSPTTITIGWQPPPVDVLDYIHYYELIVEKVGGEGVEKEEAVHPQNSRNLPYMFDNLKAATEYIFKVRACSDLTKLCGNWSVPVNGTTMDGEPSRPLNLKVTCVHANISSRSSVEISWDAPQHPNGVISVYQTVLLGIASYRTGNNEYRNETFGPKSKYEEKLKRTVYDAIPANTNYTVRVSAITRNKQRPGVWADAQCQMPVTVPDTIPKFVWGRVKAQNDWIFSLNMPRISERNGPICCYLIYIVRIPKGGSIQQLPYPDKLEVLTYQQVHHPNNTRGGVYIAEIMDGDNFNQKVFLGEGRMQRPGSTSAEGSVSNGADRWGHALDDQDLFRKCLLLRDGKYHWSGRRRIRTANIIPVAEEAIGVEPAQSVGGDVEADATTTTVVPPQSRRRRRRQHAEMKTDIQSLPSYEVIDEPLVMDSDYTGFVEVIVKTEDGNSIITTFSDYFDRLTPGGDPTVAGDDLNVIYMLDFVVHILLAMILLLVILLVLLSLFRRYHLKKIARMNQDGDEVISLRDSLRALCGGGRSNNNHHLHHHRHLGGSGGGGSAKTPDIAPIPREEMQQAFVSRHKDSDYGFQQEFEMLPDRFNDRTTKNSDAKDNSGKNRYPDIKAYDQTRVKLSTLNGGLSGSDYINANFVIGYKERKKFICAQGPMEGTVTDFWRMIWEQHLEIMVMLTNLEEYNKTKCAKYWPEKVNDSQQYGDICVKYVNEERFSDYLVRELRIVKKGHHSNNNNNNCNNGATENGSAVAMLSTSSNESNDSESRLILQYHYLVWKDFMAPEHPQGITKFIKQINSVYSVQRGPILVHCSAGVGRTGTLVALDSLLQQLEEENQVSIFNTVCDLRHQRNFLVQSLKQYIFLYRALMEMAVFGSTEVMARNLSATVEALKQRPNDDESAKCPLELQFEKIKNSIDDQIGLKKTTVQGGSVENGPKNRDPSILPYDRNRVILTPISTRENSTYINASFIEGNDNTETFIITQDPMAESVTNNNNSNNINSSNSVGSVNTVGDLWRMISEQSISTLVMISEIGEGAKRCPRYWADDEVQYDHILVKYIQSESCPYYTRREFKVTNCKIDDTIQVTQFQYNGWPTVEGEVPEVCRGIIELVDQASRHHADVQQLYTNAGPIAVHCNLGTERSGIFVAMCFLVQMLRVEKKVDVCSVVRKLRSQRMGMIDTYAQFEFLHRAIVNYADLHKLSTDSPVSHSD